MAQGSGSIQDWHVGWMLLLAVCLKLGHLMLSALALGRRLSSKNEIRIKYEVVQRGDTDASKPAVLVTGGCGFLARHIVELLLERFSNHFTIHVFDAGAKLSHKHPRATYIQGDMRSPAHVHAAVRGKAAVVHCAALLEGADTDVELLRQVNVQGTRHVIEACLEADTQALVYTSSVTVHYCKRQLELVPRVMETEPTPPEFNLTSEYAKTKKEAERLVVAANSHVLRTCVLRLGGIHGFGDKVLTDAVFRRWAAVPETKATKLPHVWVRDAARAHVAALIALLHPPASTPSIAPALGTPAPAVAAAAAAAREHGSSAAQLLAHAVAPWPAPLGSWDPETQVAYGSVRLGEDTVFQRVFGSVAAGHATANGGGGGGMTAAEQAQGQGAQAEGAKPGASAAGRVFHVVYDETPPYQVLMGGAYPAGSKTNVFGGPALPTTPAWLLQRLANLNLYLGQRFGVTPLDRLLCPASMSMIERDAEFDVSQSKGVLGWQPTPWQTVVGLILAEREAAKQTHGRGEVAGRGGKAKTS